MNQPIIKLLQRLKDKCKKVICKYNNKLRNTYKYTPTKEVKNDKNINLRGLVKKCSDLRICLNLNDHQLNTDCYKHSLV